MHKVCKRWAQAGLWTSKEAVFLTLGYYHCDFREAISEGAEPDDFEFLGKRIQTAIDLKKLKPLSTKEGEKLYPTEYVAWAQSEGIDIPAELVEAVEAYGLSPSPKDILTERPLGTKEKNSILKVLHGIIKANYKIDVSSASAPNEITKIVKDVLKSEDINEDTVRKWVGLALGIYQK